MITETNDPMVSAGPSSLHRLVVASTPGPPEQIFVNREDGTRQLHTTYCPASFPAGSVLRHPRQPPGHSSSLRCGRCAWTPAAGAAHLNHAGNYQNGHNNHNPALTSRPLQGWTPTPTTAAQLATAGQSPGPTLSAIQEAA